MLTPKSLDNTVWLAEPCWLLRTADRLARLKEWPTHEQVLEARQAAAGRMRSVSGKVGVIPVHGMIEQRLGFMGALFGGTATEDVGRELDAMLADKAIDAIVLHIDSGGGTSYGVQELGEKIHAARGRKPVYAMIDSFGASAAYWLASQAKQVVITPGGDTGSVGVYTLHADYSQAAEREGVRFSVVKAGKYKVEGNPYEPLTAEARDHLQEMVDETYSEFVRAVARGRGVTPEAVRSGYGEGRVVSARKAKAAGMVDKIMSFNDLMHNLVGDGGSAGRAASAEVLRLRHQFAKVRVRNENTKGES
jgi:signal peptide peptidase SppA